MQGDALNIVTCAEIAEKGWTDAPGRGGATAIVNIGSMLAQLTNDRWRAVPHRVVVPNAEEEAHSRYTLPFFVTPDVGTVISAHPSLVQGGEQPRYPTTTSDECLQRRLDAIQIQAPRANGGA